MEIGVARGTAAIGRGVIARGLIATAAVLLAGGLAAGCADSGNGQTGPEADTGGPRVAPGDTGSAQDTDESGDDTSAPLPDATSDGGGNADTTQTDVEDGCEAQCDLDARRCDGQTIQMCGDWDRDGCREWRDSATCTGAERCSGGTCRQPMTRFAKKADTWAVPDGGAVDGRGFWMATGLSDAPGSELWQTTDLTGDGKPDLVVTGSGHVSGGPTAFGNGDTRHWKVFENEGSGFRRTAQKWSLPDGGDTGDGSFHSTQDTNQKEGADTWTTLDLTGDGKPDLVATAVGDVNDTPRIIDRGAQHLWRVFSNTGDGFSDTPIEWSVPKGGELVGRGFATVQGRNSEQMAETWRTRDMTGDAKPDLVVTGTGDGQAPSAFKSENGRYWKVYENKGDGFAAQPIEWTLPGGGSPGGRGFASTSGFHFEAGAPSWETRDLTGDGIPELVITAVRSGSGAPGAPQWGGEPVWRVYNGTPTGFETSPVYWTLPDGGAEAGRSFWTLTDGTASPGSEIWATTDIDQDGKPDLVVTAARPTDGPTAAFGTPGNRYWKVYSNTGQGFAEQSTQWGIPDDGATDSAGYHFFQQWNGDAGDEVWFVGDLSGDGGLDLVVSGEIGPDGPAAFGSTGSRHWKVFGGAN